MTLSSGLVGLIIAETAPWANAHRSPGDASPAGLEA
jgi:hypothetical protein